MEAPTDCTACGRPFRPSELYVHMHGRVCADCLPDAVAATHGPPNAGIRGGPKQGRGDPATPLAPVEAEGA